MPSSVSVLEPTIEAEMERAQITGLAIAIVDRAEVVWTKGYGVRDIETREPVTPETCFSVMSVTKPIVATALMQLRDEGTFHLDDPANEHLAPISIKNDWEAESPVTVRQLLTHTGGLPVGTGVSTPGKQTLEQFVDNVVRTDRRPGEEIVYANWGYDAIGVLIERLSGKPADACVNKRIFEPLAMSSSILGEPMDGLPRATGHYVSAIDRSVHTLPFPEWPVTPATEGGVWSSVLDLARFLGTHLNCGALDGQWMQPHALAEMHELHARQGNSESGMGLGFRVTRSNGRRMICHGGDGGGFTAFIGGFPEEGIGVAMLMNTAGMQTARSVIANEALRLFAKSHEERRAFSGSSARRPGIYRSTYWDIEAEVRDGEAPSLTVTEGLVVSGEPTVSTLAPTDDGRFQADGGMFHGFEVTFEDAADGARLYGGVYPFTFVRQGNLQEPEPVDESADLMGAWKGNVQTPMGALAVEVDVLGGSDGTISTPFAQGVGLENFRAETGRVEGEFEMSVPGVGEFRNFLRLEARGGRLAGKAYARSSFGENAMRTELEREGM